MSQDIDRLIKDRFSEVHPFESEERGMIAFARLFTLLKNCDDEDFVHHIAEIEKLFVNTRACFSCDIKLRIFLSIFCKGQMQEKADRYLKEAKELQASHRGERDYFQEVNEMIRFYEKEAENDRTPRKREDLK